MDADPHGVSPAAWVRVSARIAFFTFCRFHRSAVRLLDTVRSSGTSISKRCLMAAPSCRVCGASAPVRVRAVGSPAPAPPGRGRSERRGVVATAGAAAGPGVAALLAAVAALSAVRGSGRVAATSAAVLPATDLLRLRRCPAERHRNLVRVELPAVAVVTGLAILPLLRLERPGRGDPVALADGLGDVLGLVPPHGDAETVLRPIDVLVALLLALRLHHHERRDRDAGLREPQ